MILLGKMVTSPWDYARPQISMLSYFHGENAQAWQDTGC